MPGRPNNAVVIDACTTRVRALKNYVDGDAPIAVNGTQLVGSEVLAIYQRCLEARATLAANRAAIKAAIGLRAITEEARRLADRDLKSWVVNQFGVESKEAIEFGFPPPRVPTRSVENKASTIALTRATRQARHTMGARRRLSITGALPPPAAGASPPEGEAT